MLSCLLATPPRSPQFIRCNFEMFLKWSQIGGATCACFSEFSALFSLQPVFFLLLQILQCLEMQQDRAAEKARVPLATS